MKKIKCESCGANLEFDDDLTTGYCMYCGAKYMLEEKVNVNVNVKVDNGNENKIKLANNYIDEGNYEKADKLFKDVLADDATNHEAWWGRYICETYYAAYYGYEDNFGNTGPDVKKKIISDNLKLAYNAIDNAPLEIKTIYRKYIKEDEDYINSL